MQEATVMASSSNFYFIIPDHPPSPHYPSDFFSLQKVIEGKCGIPTRLLGLGSSQTYIMVNLHYGELTLW